MNSKKDLYNSKFSHIYVEKGIRDHFRTRQILEKFPNAIIVEIDHYKDLFNRRHQDTAAQYLSQALILAAKYGNNIYPGSRVCQSFDNDYFYYTSNVMNCIFSCEYCYLKGMYPSGNMVVFVNIEDTFEELEEILKAHEAYVCVSYDTDLMALEDITGFVSDWCDFTYSHPNLKIEIRTKSARKDLYDIIKASDRIIFAYTISPSYVADRYESGAGSMEARIAAAAYALDRGFSIRLCFDPMIYCRDWKKEYGEMIEKTAAVVDFGRLQDVSVGTFRISQDYMKQMRKNYGGSSVVQFPYENKDGVYQYPDRIRDEMEKFLISGLSAYISPDRIYLWEE